MLLERVHCSINSSNERCAIHGSWLNDLTLYQKFTTPFDIFDFTSFSLQAYLLI